VVGHPPGYPRPPVNYHPPTTAADFGSQAWLQAGTKAQSAQLPVQLQASTPLLTQSGLPPSQQRLQIQTAQLPMQSSALPVQSAPQLPQATPVPSGSSQLSPQGGSLQMQSGPLQSQSIPLQVQSAPLPPTVALLQPQNGMLTTGPLQTPDSGSLQQSSSRPLLTPSNSVASQIGMPRSASMVITGSSAAAQAAIAAEVQPSFPPVQPPSFPPDMYTAPSPSAGSDYEGGDDVNLDWVVWSPDDVGDFVDGLLGLGAGAPFRREEVDGPMLVRLTDDNLRDAMGIRDPLHRAKLLGHLRAFKARRERLAKRAAKRKAAPGKQPHSPQAATPPVPKGHGHAAQGENCLRSVGSTAAVSRRPISGASSVTGLMAGPTAFGQDTPSTSLRGSFSTAMRHPVVISESTPGPAAYDVMAAEGSSATRSSPIKATIGKSPRRTADHFTQDVDAPGPSSYNVGSAGTRATTSPRPTIGNSVRKTSQISETDIGPGPCSYNIDTGFLRASSPRPTMGTSQRNTTEFIINRDAAKAMKSRQCRSSGRLHSPRGKSPSRSED